MQKITPCLWFDNNAEEAVNHYLSIFKNSKINKILRCGDAGPGPKGSVLTIAFQLEGQDFIALNGGPTKPFRCRWTANLKRKLTTYGRSYPPAAKRASVDGSKTNSDCRGKWSPPYWSRCYRTRTLRNPNESWPR